MKTYTLKVYASNSLAQKLKKIAALRGKSVSETAAEMIDIGLNLPESSTTEGSTVGSVSFGEHPSASGLSPEIVRYQVQNLAKIENLLRQISRLLSPGNAKEHIERVRVAEGKAKRILKKLKMDAIEDVDRIEMEVLTEEEMFKDLDLDTNKDHIN